MFYKVEVEVRSGEIWEHIESGRRYSVNETLPGEVLLIREGLTTCETPQAFVYNYRMVSSPLRGAPLVADES